LEALPDPKEQLHALLVSASEKQGRRLKNFQRDINVHVHRVAEYIDDFSPLECLPAFQAFEHDTKAVVERILSA
jgi:hypothetical protein